MCSVVRSNITVHAIKLNARSTRNVLIVMGNKKASGLGDGIPLCVYEPKLDERARGSRKGYAFEVE